MRALPKRLEDQSIESILWCPHVNTTLSPVTVQRFTALQGELIGLVEQDYSGLTPKLEQFIQALEFTQIELAVFLDRHYAQGRGVGKPVADRCAMACAFLAKAVLDLKTTRALIDRLQADSKLRRLCGFDLRFALPSETTFSRAFEEFASGELMQRVHARMIQDTLGDQLIGHISRDSTAIEARESLAKKDKAEVVAQKPKGKPGRPKNDDARPANGCGCAGIGLNYSVERLGVTASGTGLMVQVAKVAFILSMVCALGGAFARTHAVLIGVGEYALGKKYALEGPANDAAAMRDVLVRRWGVDPENAIVLTDKAATKAAIVQALRSLAARSQPGDEVVVYLSGHGTSAVDSNELVPMPYGSGAFLPHDFDPSTPERALATALVGRTDLLPLYQALEKGGRRVWVISDSCYSGNQVRSIAQDHGALPGRFVPLALGRARHTLEADASRALQAGRPIAWPYQNLVFLAASAEGEIARDIPSKALGAYPTASGQPHGALTDALLRILGGQIAADYDGDGQLSLAEVHRAAGQFMSTRGYGHTPVRLPSVADDEAVLSSRPLLRFAGAGKVTAPAVPETSPFKVWVGGTSQQVDIALRASGALRAPEARSADAILRIDQSPVRLLLPSGDLLATWTGQASADDLKGPLGQLALDKRWHLLAQQMGKGLLAAEVVPSVQGGNMRIGQKVHFSVRPDRPATLLLVNIDANGKVTTLYPTRSVETRPMEAGLQKAIPGSAHHEQIVVRPPLGMDIQFSLAFDRPPAQLERMMTWNNVAFDDSSLALLEQALTEARGRFSFARTVLRTYP